MSRRYSSVMVGLIVIVMTALSLLGALPLKELLTDFQPIRPHF